MQEIIFSISRYALICLSLVILFRCLRSLLSDRYETEVWAYLKVGKNILPVTHWENIIGKGASADLRVFGPGIGRTHAVLKRRDNGVWEIYDVFSKGGVWVNGERVPHYGTELADGDLINLGGSCVTFLDEKYTEAYESEIRVSPVTTLIELGIFQIFLLIQHMYSCEACYVVPIIVSFALVILLEWILYGAMHLLGRNGFEVEILSFYLTTLGLSVAASSTPDDVIKQIILISASVLLFAICGWWQSSLKRTTAMRIPVAVFAVLLLGLNVISGYSVNGAANWLTFGGYSFQPSELVKVCYVYVGASTLEMLYKKNNLYVFIGFSAVCVMALALIGDFGTAVIFFATFLVISFLRSGSIATVILALTGAGLAGFLAVSVKPYILRRFETWGHVWEDVYDTGYQQTRAMSALASGGVIGKGAGSGWLKSIFAANTDMVFAMEAEELGLIVALSMIFAMIILAFFAVRMAKRGRSSFYAIAACATMAMLLTQMALNVFGSLDILPFTGVTFPFVSRGGSSLISCWMLMAFLKSADNRVGASFAVRKSPGMIFDIDEQDEEEQDNFEDSDDEADDEYDDLIGSFEGEAEDNYINDASEKEEDKSNCSWRFFDDDEYQDEPDKKEVRRK